MSNFIKAVTVDEGVYKVFRPTFKSVKICDTASFATCYQFTRANEFSNALHAFLLEDVGCGVVAAERVSQYIAFYAYDMLKTYQREAALVSVSTMRRATFVGPRWHTVGECLGQTSGCKRVGTLQGPPTRFGVTRQRERFDRLERERAQILNRFRNDGVALGERMAAIDKEINAIVFSIPEPLDRDGVYIKDFRFGTEGTILSEPAVELSDSRLSFSIVPGTEAAISHWLKRV